MNKHEKIVLKKATSKVIDSMKKVLRLRLEQNSEILNDHKRKVKDLPLKPLKDYRSRAIKAHREVDINVAFLIEKIEHLIGEKLA